MWNQYCASLRRSLLGVYTGFEDAVVDNRKVRDIATTEADGIALADARLDEAIGDLVGGCVQLGIREPGSLTDESSALGYHACAIVEQDSQV